VEYQANESNEPRSTIIWVNNVIQIQVIQDGKDCEATLSDYVVQVPVSGGSADIQVATNGQYCHWETETEEDWLYVSPSTSMGSGTASINVFAENTDVEARQGTATIAGHEVAVIQAGTGGPGILPTEDLLGWWWDPAQSGSGISIELHAKGKYPIFLGWFTYDGNGDPVWYVASLTYSRENIYTGEIYDVRGWPLGAPYGGYRMNSVGTIELDFASSEACSVTYVLNGVQGSLDIERFMTQERYPGEPNQRNISGWWKDPAWDGMGWFIETRGDSMYAVWYHYENDCSTRWWGFGGDVGGFPVDEQSDSNPLVQYRGGTGIGGEPKLYSEVTSMGQASLVDSGNGVLKFTYNGVTYNLVPADF